ncbi:hypothetical protein B0H34DRAFT_718953 [Crassisporium funariophilum]|nr:hypothetical protein B0H34DRAFT_718953 [Crassisporium funariophilum]
MLGVTGGVVIVVANIVVAEAASCSGGRDMRERCWMCEWVCENGFRDCRSLQQETMLKNHLQSMLVLVPDVFVAALMVGGRGGGAGCCSGCNGRVRPQWHSRDNSSCSSPS